MRGLQAVLVIGLTLVVLSACHGAETYEFVGQLGENGLDRGELVDPGGVAVDGSGNVFVSQGSVIQTVHMHKFRTDGTFVLRWGYTGSDDKEFHWPQHVAVDALGNVYVADTLNDRIQKFDTDGNFLGKWGFSGSADGQFSDPTGVAVAPSEHVYVVDKNNRRVQTFTSDGEFIAKWGSQGVGDGQFSNPIDIAADASGNLYVTDWFRDIIQKFGPSGNFITKWGSDGSGDGEFYDMRGVATDAEGNVYVTDMSLDRVQKFTSDGTFITKWGSSGHGDGEFNGPQGIDVDALGNVYVADQGNSRIQVFARVPVMDWAGTPGFDSDGVRPNRGQKYDLFAFKVKYTDASGAAPQYCRVVITRNSSAYKTLSMRKVSGSVTAGRIYKAEVRLPTGEYTYRFEGASAVGAATGEPTAEMDGPMVEWPRQSRPDGLVWGGARWLGDNIYNTTGAKQRVNGSVERGDKIAYTVKVQNDRADTDTLIVRGPAATGKWRFTYLTAAGAGITGAVTGAGWSTGPLAAGASTRIKLRMEALSSASIGATKAATVRVGRASWGPTKYGEQADAVKCNSTVVAGATGTLQLAGLSVVPTTKGAQITFSLSALGSVQARVLNLAGRPVKTICTARECEAGANTLVWNSRSDAGLAAPNGTYLVEVTARTEGGEESRALAQVRVGR